MEGNLRFKIDWASLMVRRNLLFLLCFTLTAWKLKFRGSFWTFYIQGMNFSSFQAMEPKNEPS